MKNEVSLITSGVFLVSSIILIGVYFVLFFIATYGYLTPFSRILYVNGELLFNPAIILLILVFAVTSFLWFISNLIMCGISHNTKEDFEE